jgi:hypothetical protein
MGVVYETYRGEEKFSWREPRERENKMEDVGVHKKKILKLLHMEEIKYESVDWTDQTQECDKGWTLVNTVMNPRNPLNTCKFSKG